MSIAGTHSNRGDHYQTLIAFDWALTVLSNPEFEWIEIDSVSYEVDDIVIGRSDRTTICCQCKKNQPDSRAWSIADLSGELKKAFLLLHSTSKVEVYFYSRTPFGAIVNLQEHNITQVDEAGYLASLGQKHRPTEKALKSLLKEPEQTKSSFDFLRRITFEVTPDFKQLELKLLERLQYLVNNPQNAYDALYRNLFQLGTKIDGSLATTTSGHRHRLNKADLFNILHTSGSMLAPPINKAEVLRTFQSTSIIGRSWNREIAGKRIPAPVLEKMLTAIEEKKNSILLTGLPGSGKTCVMLSLQEELEQREKNGEGIAPLFIQSREFADLKTAHDREALGLPEQWVQQVARISEDTHTVVVIDSLDVLSIAREHAILSYFLAQIDRLLLLPNITVVTACREFDRKYDRRIAQRSWDCELKCEPLSWDNDIEPLLSSFGIETTAIDPETQSLIKNPRELGLFVELAQEKGSFNVVTAQELAQRYLVTFIKDNDALDDRAMEAIENIAHEMLVTRKLSIPPQKYSSTKETLRSLLSLNILRSTEAGELTFGHQTLLDVLVISRAIRGSCTLNQFIMGLPPVPFVRPSVRSFIAQLAAGERREFRMQIREVLTGSSAFHIRRLVAEAFAEQAPKDDDWSLIRDLRRDYRDVFQVIYIQGKRIEWHNFWLTHLVPLLKDIRDEESIATHVHHIAQWKNDDAKGVISFWEECLDWDWFNDDYLVDRLPFQLEKLEEQHLQTAAPLLIELLKKPRKQHSYIGHAVARFVKSGALEDKWLWEYIAGEVTEQDITKFNFNKKLHCKPHDFGSNDDSFLKNQMCHSDALLELAIKAIEEWSHVQSERYDVTPYCGFYTHYLRNTSYNKTHTKMEHHHVDDGDLLLRAVETAVFKHIENNSAWWSENQNRICLSHEAALRYIGITGCTRNPTENRRLIEIILSDPNAFRSSLFFELGTLIQNSFILISDKCQNNLLELIADFRSDKLIDGENSEWVLRDRAELVSTIPCHLRSEKAQSIINEYEGKHGQLIRLPFIHCRGGSVRAPFSFELLHKISDVQVIRLLDHYDEYESHFDDYGVGGSQEVGWQLRQAVSEAPCRFLSLLRSSWSDIPPAFRDRIVGGVSDFLRYNYGNLQSGDKWEARESPNAKELSELLLSELEKHPYHWHHNSEATQVIEACANVVEDKGDAARLVFLSIGFLTLRSKLVKTEHSEQIYSNIDSLDNVAEGLMILANQLAELDKPFPELLPPTLRQYAKLGHERIQTSILERLPYLQHKNPELGWEIFDLCMKESEGLWQIAERCLYYAYADNYDDIVAPLLDRMPSEGNPEELETWGRISALSTLSDKIEQPDFIKALQVLNSAEAWRGAAGVWTHTGNITRDREKCLAGIEAGLNSSVSHAIEVAQQLESLFSEESRHIDIPLEFIRLCFNAFEQDAEKSRRYFWNFEDWINTKSQYDPCQALDLTEIYLGFMKKTKEHLHDYKDTLTQLMTRLFAEAEERELSDRGEMLRRVVKLQDLLLSMGVEGVNDWLKSAERP